MALSTRATGDPVAAADHNEAYQLLKGQPGSGEQVKLVYNAASALLIQPSSDPAASTDAIQVNNNAGTVLAAITYDGKFEAADGTVALPGVTFEDDTDTGIYRTGANAMAVTAGGVLVAPLAIATATVAGFVPTPPNNTTTFLRGDATFAAPVLTITNSNAKLGANVVLTSVNTQYDGPSLSLVAGTYLVAAHVTAIAPSGAASGMTTRISDGTTHYASVQNDIAANQDFSQSLSTILVLSSTTTIKVQMASTANTGTAASMLAAAPNNGAGNNATQISAIKIA